MFKSNKGFTLVELIVVIAILAILAAIAIPTYSGYITKAKDAAVVSELAAVLTAAQAANATTGGDVSSIAIEADGSIKVDGSTVTDGSDFDVFYGSHTFDTSIMAGTTYAKGADWANNTWTPGT